MAGLAWNELEVELHHMSTIGSPTRKILGTGETQFEFNREGTDLEALSGKAVGNGVRYSQPWIW